MKNNSSRRLRCKRKKEFRTTNLREKLQPNSKKKRIGGKMVSKSNCEAKSNKKSSKKFIVLSIFDRKPKTLAEEDAIRRFFKNVFSK
ncbi:MAG: hypothetical protein MUO78_07440 [candidate division Zixibacteria bacterium]|nr:hypothetical protein [candidate division Zixibacteria bacterium]